MDWLLSTDITKIQPVAASVHSPHRVRPVLMLREPYPPIARYGSIIINRLPLRSGPQLPCPDGSMNRSHVIHGHRATAPLAPQSANVRLYNIYVVVKDHCDIISGPPQQGCFLQRPVVALFDSRKQSLDQFYQEFPSAFIWQVPHN